MIATFPIIVGTLNLILIRTNFGKKYKKYDPTPPSGDFEIGELYGTIYIKSLVCNWHVFIKEFGVYLTHAPLLINISSPYKGGDATSLFNKLIIYGASNNAKVV